MVSENLCVINLDDKSSRCLGQTRYENEPFYFTSNIINFEVKNGKYFWFDPTSFNIVNEQTGIIDKTISFEAKNFMINSKDEIILIGSDNQEIFYYDFRFMISWERSCLN